MKGKHAKTTAKKLKLAKRTLALCFAAVFLCSCMLPVFATGSSLTDALREAVEETTSSVEESTGSTGGTMMDSFQSYYADYIAEKATTYRFWLDEKDSYDLDGITSTSASELAQYDDFYKVVKIENNAPLSAPDGFKNPTDPTGAGRKFEGWYYIDTYGLTQTFTFSGDIQSIDTDSTVDVFAKWGEAPAEEPATKDPEEGKTTEEDTKTEETIKTVDLTGKVELDYYGDTPVTMTVKAYGLPAKAQKLQVASLDDAAWEEFSSLYTGQMTALEGFEISPKDVDGNTVEPDGAVKVAISDFNSIGMSADGTVKVLHLVNGSVETLDAMLSNGTLTFETTSFSPFVVAAGEDDLVDPLKITYNKEMVVGETITLSSDLWGTYHSWTTSDKSIADVKDHGSTATVYGKKQGTVTITHTAQYWDNRGRKIENTDEYKLEIKTGPAGNGGWVYLYVKVGGDTTGLTLNGHGWYTIGKIWVADIPDPTESVTLEDGKHYDGNTEWTTDGNGGSVAVETKQSASTGAGYYKKVKDAVGTNGTGVTRYTPNGSIKFEEITWEGFRIVPKDDGNGTHGQYFGLIRAQGADYYEPDGGLITWHLDGYIDAKMLGNYQINYLEEGTNKVLQDPDTGVGSAGEDVLASTFSDLNQTISYNGEQYDYVRSDVERVTIRHGTTVEINLYYKQPTDGFKIEKQVTGNMGDLEQEFMFSVTVTKSNGSPLTDYVVTDQNDTEYKADSTGNVTFRLKHGKSVEVSGVPNNAIVTITETDADGYTVSAQLDGGQPILKNSATFTFLYKLGSVSTSSLSEDYETVSEDEDSEVVLYAATGGDGQIDSGDTVTIINFKDMEVPTGVILDTLPYILMLIAVGAGVVLFIFHKRHHDDD